MYHAAALKLDCLPTAELRTARNNSRQQVARSTINHCIAADELGAVLAHCADVVLEAPLPDCASMLSKLLHRCAQCGVRAPVTACLVQSVRGAEVVISQNLCSICFSSAAEAPKAALEFAPPLCPRTADIVSVAQALLHAGFVHHLHLSVLRDVERWLCIPDAEAPKRHFSVGIPEPVRRGMLSMSNLLELLYDFRRDFGAMHDLTALVVFASDDWAAPARYHQYVLQKQAELVGVIHACAALPMFSEVVIAGGDSVLHASLLSANGLALPPSASRLGSSFVLAAKAFQRVQAAQASVLLPSLGFDGMCQPPVGYQFRPSLPVVVVPESTHTPVGYRTPSPQPV